MLFVKLLLHLFNQIASSKILVITQILFIAKTVTQIRLFERHCDESEMKLSMKIKISPHYKCELVGELVRGLKSPKGLNAASHVFYLSKTLRDQVFLCAASPCARLAMDNDFCVFEMRYFSNAVGGDRPKESIEHLNCLHHIPIPREHR